MSGLQLTHRSRRDWIYMSPILRFACPAKHLLATVASLNLDSLASNSRHVAGIKFGWTLEYVEIQ